MVETVTCGKWQATTSTALHSAGLMGFGQVLGLGDTGVKAGSACSFVSACREHTAGISNAQVRLVLGLHMHHAQNVPGVFMFFSHAAGCTHNVLICTLILHLVLATL